MSCTLQAWLLNLPAWLSCVIASCHLVCISSCERAKNELDYKPLVSMEEGIQRTLNFFADLKKSSTNTAEEETSYNSEQEQGDGAPEQEASPAHKKEQ